jgi:hypothetical protein
MPIHTPQRTRQLLPTDHSVIVRVNLLKHPAQRPLEHLLLHQTRSSHILVELKRTLLIPARLSKYLTHVLDRSLVLHIERVLYTLHQLLEIYLAVLVLIQIVKL